MRKNGSSSDRDLMLFGLRIVGDFGASIAIPVVLLAWIGKTLDDKWGTAPWFLIVGFALAAMISAFTVHRKAREYGHEYQKLLDRQQEEKNEEKP